MKTLSDHIVKGTNGWGDKTSALSTFKVKQFIKDIKLELASVHFIGRSRKEYLGCITMINKLAGEELTK